MTTSRFSAFVLVTAAVVAGGLGLACTTTTTSADADAARSRDEAACLKMCEVAGETSSTPEAVTACQKDCTAGER